eukprot:TRINITY_DN49628_c0_g1_i1.p1 TRINITY_DN49628_c0_g1~~TRINITY_DN49628_c0_g1_i1.p1  ORF type:complete len:1439 (-),score=259.18 TRINITY_DN49628_c0_g1_i1:354-4670(-)
MLPAVPRRSVSGSPPTAATSPATQEGSIALAMRSHQTRRVSFEGRRLSIVDDTSRQGAIPVHTARRSTFGSKDSSKAPHVDHCPRPVHDRLQVLEANIVDIERLDKLLSAREAAGAERLRHGAAKLESRRRELVEETCARAATAVGGVKAEATANDLVSKALQFRPPNSARTPVVSADVCSAFDPVHWKTAAVNGPRCRSAMGAAKKPTSINSPTPRPQSRPAASVNFSDPRNYDAWWAQASKWADNAHWGDCMFDASIARDVPGNTVDTSLLWAAESGCTRACQLMLERKADVNVTARRGITSLMLAAGGGHVCSVRFLLGASADANLVDVGGRSAFDMSLRNNHFEIADILLQGASMNVRMRKDTIEKAKRFGHSACTSKLCAEVHVVLALERVAELQGTSGVDVARGHPMFVSEGTFAAKTSPPASCLRLRQLISQSIARSQVHLGVRSNHVRFKHHHFLDDANGSAQVSPASFQERFTVECIISLFDASPSAVLMGLKATLEMPGGIQLPQDCFLRVDGELSRASISWPTVSVCKDVIDACGHDLTTCIDDLVEAVEASAAAFQPVHQALWRHERDTMVRLLLLDSRWPHGSLPFMTAVEGRRQGLPRIPLRQPEELTLTKLRRDAADAQSALKAIVAPGTAWAGQDMNCESEIPADDPRRMMVDSGFAIGGVAIDQGTKPLHFIRKRLAELSSGRRNPRLPYEMLVDVAELKLVYRTAKLMMDGLGMFRQTFEVHALQNDFRYLPALGFGNVALYVRVPVGGERRPGFHIAKVCFSVLAMTQAGEIEGGEAQRRMHRLIEKHCPKNAKLEVVARKAVEVLDTIEGGLSQCVVEAELHKRDEVEASSLDGELSDSTQPFESGTCSNRSKLLDENRSKTCEDQSDEIGKTQAHAFFSHSSNVSSECIGSGSIKHVHNGDVMQVEVQLVLACAFPSIIEPRADVGADLDNEGKNVEGTALRMSMLSKFHLLRRRLFIVVAIVRTLARFDIEPRHVKCCDVEAVSSKQDLETSDALCFLLCSVLVCGDAVPTAVLWALKDALADPTSPLRTSRRFRANPQRSEVRVAWPIASIMREMGSRFPFELSKGNIQRLLQIVEATQQKFYDIRRTVFENEPEAMAALLRLPCKRRFRRGGLLPKEEGQRRQLELEAVEQPEKVLQMLHRDAQTAQKSLKDSIAPGTDWVALEFDCFFDSDCEKDTAQRFIEDVGMVRNGFAFDGGVKSPIQIEAEALELVRFVEPENEQSPSSKYHIGEIQRDRSLCQPTPFYHMITDICQLSLTYYSVGALMEGINTLLETLDVCWVENRFRNPIAIGCCDVSVGVRVSIREGASYHIGEVQMSVAEMYSNHCKTHALDEVDSFLRTECAVEASDAERLRKLFLELVSKGGSARVSNRKATPPVKVEPPVRLKKPRVARGHGRKRKMAATTHVDGAKLGAT